MILRKSIVLLAAVTGIAFHIQGCQSGGVGDPCIPEDEYQQSFPGFAATEVNLESRSFQCETRVCLVYRFRGRVSCPLGQDIETDADGNVTGKGKGTGGPCHVPGSQDDVKVAVTPQCATRTAEKTVYCSCRCDGADPNGKYCDCPDGFACTKLDDLDLGAAVARGSSQLAGSYCVKKADADPSIPSDPSCKDGDKKPCTAADGNCGGVRVNPLHALAVASSATTKAMKQSPQNARSAPRAGVFACGSLSGTTQKGAAKLTSSQRGARFVRSAKAAQRGRRAEIISCDYLRAAGYRILETNVRLARGELDIVARRGDLLVAIEVRTRGPRSLTGPFASVTMRKRRRCRSALDAIWKSYAADLSIRRVRFDVHAVYLDGRTVAVEVAEGVTLF